MNKNIIRQRLLDEMLSLKTIDCHSHTQLKRNYYKSGGYDLFTLESYFKRDILSTGGKIYENTNSDNERWQKLKSVLEKSRNVTYWRHNIIVYKGLYGLKDDELTDDNWEQVNRAIKEKSLDPTWYDKVTKDICNLKTQIRNVPWFEDWFMEHFRAATDDSLEKVEWLEDWESEYFTGVLRMEPSLMLHNPKLREKLEKYLNISIDSISTLKQALIELVKLYVKRGVIGIKLAHAYDRTLHSEPVSEERAGIIFDRILAGTPSNNGEIKELQDYIIFLLAEIANEMDLVFQIHTGVQNNWDNIPDSNPLLLIPLLKSFPNVRFDLFHAGYPYSREMGMLAKHYPNVWLNMAWMYLVSTAASRQILSEWIDLVPGYRILAFGSDVRYPELIYGHLEMARSCIADVLISKIECDYLSEQEALSLTGRIFYNNAVELYKL